MSILSTERPGNRKSKRTTPPQQQRGVALISVLLVFALVTVIAAEVVSRQHRDIRRTQQWLLSEQARQYALGGEQFARQILYRDFVEAGADNSDQFSDLWARQLPPFDIDGGTMTIEIHDLRGRFNLNSLRNPNGQVNGQALAHFRQILAQLDTTRDYAPLLQDWLDADNDPAIGGAEDAVYRESGYLAANAAIGDRSELLLLEGMPVEDYKKLQALVVALPGDVDGEAQPALQYNLNTLDATILRALGPMNAAQAAQIEALQQSGGYTSLQQWFSRNETAAINTGLRSQLTVRSTFFEVLVTAEYADRISVLRSQFFRDPDDGALRLLKRQFNAAL